MISRRAVGRRPDGTSRIFEYLVKWLQWPTDTSTWYVLRLSFSIHICILDPLSNATLTHTPHFLSLAPARRTMKQADI
jgi:hypothetical protein